MTMHVSDRGAREARRARRDAAGPRSGRLACVLAACALAVAGCASAPTESSLRSDGQRPMTDAELRAEFARERSCRFDNWNSATGTVDYRPDGRFEARTGGVDVAGTWRILDGLLCAKSPQLRGGVEVCSAVYVTSATDRMAFGREDGSWTRTRCAAK
jgi:hypothetical protein